MQTDDIVRLVAAKLLVDPRTVRKELDSPGAVRGLAGARIRAELAERGIDHNPKAPAA